MEEPARVQVQSRTVDGTKVEGRVQVKHFTLVILRGLGLVRLAGSGDAFSLSRSLLVHHPAAAALRHLIVLQRTCRRKRKEKSSVELQGRFYGRIGQESGMEKFWE